MTSAVFIRRETANDVDAIRHVHNLAFGSNANTLSWEARLVDDLRAGTSWIPALSIVAEVTGLVVGHALATRGHLEPAGPTTAEPALGLAPVGVLPDFQHLGIGTKLLHALLGAAQALDEELVCLLGNPAYYHRFGFVLASSLGIGPPDPTWTPHFQALHLTPHPWATTPATFRYDPAFDRQP